MKTAFDVAKPFVVSKILTLRGVLGHLTAALLAEIQDVCGSASFENNSGTRDAFAKVVWRLLANGNTDNSAQLLSHGPRSLFLFVAFIQRHTCERICVPMTCCQVSLDTFQEALHAHQRRN